MISDETHNRPPTGEPTCWPRGKARGAADRGPDSQGTSIKVYDETRERIRDLASKNGQTMAGAVRQVFEKGPAALAAIQELDTLATAWAALEGHLRQVRLTARADELAKCRQALDKILAPLLNGEQP